MQYLLIALTYGINVYAPNQICVERKQVMWLERRIQQLTVDILRLMFKKLYTCLQFGDAKAGFVFLMLDENWLKIFVNRIKSNTAQTCTLKSATSYFDCSKNIYYSKQENWRLSQADEFLSGPVVEIIGINWAKVIMHSSSI